MEWITVDRAGLARLMERNGAHRVVLELVQNAWDEPGVTSVDVALDPTPGRRGRSILEVVDDAPSGFAHLADMFTLFAPSTKLADPGKRGRFNMGEKLTLAICDEAEIVSTSGGYRFDAVGRHRLRSSTESGTRFRAVVRLTGEQRQAALDLMTRLIPPTGIVTTVNGTVLPNRDPVREFTATLRTEAADDTGVLRPTRRQTTVALHQVRDGETAHLYEMGIPVVAIDLPFHANIGQRVPLNMERDNVSAAWLRDLRVAVLNETVDLLTADEASNAWVRDAAGDPRVSDDAVRHVITCRFGKKAVVYDPSDPEGTKIAVAHGYTVVTGGALSKGEWEQVKRAAALLPAGQVTPSPKVLTSADGVPPIPREKWTPPMEAMADYAAAVGQHLLGKAVDVEFARVQNRHAAWYGGSTLTFNLSRLGRRFVDAPNQRDVDALLLHEYAHNKVSDHLSRNFADEIARLGARLRDCPAQLDAVPASE